MSMLTVENVTAGYVEEIDILRNVNLEVNEGVITGIIGANGAGKSTLMNILGCLDTPDAGKYILEGEDVSMHPP